MKGWLRIQNAKDRIWARVGIAAGELYANIQFIIPLKGGSKWFKVLTL